MSTELISEVRNHPAVFGYYLRDEPTASFFPGLATVSSVVKELHPGVWPYINLFPNYADASQLGTKTYDEYVEKFIEDLQAAGPELRPLCALRRRRHARRILRKPGIDAPSRGEA